MRFIISLSHDQWARLREVANAERRRPQDEAAILLGRMLSSDTLRQSGLVSTAPGAATPSSGYGPPTDAEEGRVQP